MPDSVVQRIADQADRAIVDLRQHVFLQPVAAVDLVLLVHAEVEPVLEQADAVGADDGHRDAVGVGRNGADRGAVVLGADRIPDQPRDLAAERREGLDRAERHLVAEGVVLADEGHVAQAELLVEILAERMADLARRDRGAHHGRRAVPLGDVVGAGRVHHQRHAGLLAHLRDRRTFMAAQRADQEVHLLLQHQTARLGQRLVRIAGGVAGDDLDLAAAGRHAGLLPEQPEAVDHLGAGRGERTGDRRQEADPDRPLVLRLRGGEAGSRAASGQSRNRARELSERMHVPSLEPVMLVMAPGSGCGATSRCLSARRLPP